ncbi:MAG TPA: polysaccharide biosynthesis C-terminal domain-containing protein [Myxococcaceae bacterium]|nr:polysaccharide biosynthesis C-terminal domain-containing protein [Myxococcaceae bacterium]
MADAAPLAQDSTHHDAKIAVRNAIQLGLSLVATYGLGMVVKLIFLPRMLGPMVMGIFNPANAAANTTFLLTTFGMEPYAQKEVSVRIEHANDFVAGVMIIRSVMFFVLSALMTLVLTYNGQSMTYRLTALGMGGMWALYQQNSAFGGLLTAGREVRGLARINVTNKVVWGVAVVAAVLLGGGVVGVAMAFFFAEALKAVLIYREVFRRLPIKLKVNWPGTFGALKSAIPFMLNSLSLIYSKLDQNMMSWWHMSAPELGWYGTAVDISSFTLALTPLLGGAILPLFSRAAARSREELNAVGARTMSTILTFALAVGFAMSLASELVVRLTAGTGYLPAVPALMILCANFTCTYVAVVSSYFMWASGRPWTMTGISAFGLLINPIFNLIFIRPLAARGDGWGGTGAAIATVSTELFIIGILLFFVGRSVFDRKVLSMLARTALVMALVGALHVQLKPLVEAPPSWLGSPHGIPVLALRLLAEAAAYVGLAILTRAINIRETLEFARGALRARQERRVVQEPKAA